MSTRATARLSSMMGSLLIILFGLVSGWWLEIRPSPSSTQLIVGMYGEEPISLRCPTSGRITEVRVHLGQEVNTETLLFTLDAPQDQAFLAEVVRERAWAEASIKEQLSALDHTLERQSIARQVDQARAQAQVSGVEVDIRRARGQLKTLERSLSTLEAAVKTGSLSLAELTRLKSEVSGLKQIARPLGQQRSALRRAIQVKPLEDTVALIDAWRKALQRQAEVWRSFEESTRARLISATRRYAPIKAQVASLARSSGGTCRAGEEVMSLQPLTPVVRLWKLSGSQMLKPQTHLKLVLTDERDHGPDLPQRFGIIKRVGPSLVPLPEPLQPIARRALRTSALLTVLNGDPPLQVRGRPLRVHLSDDNQSWRDAVPWGASVRVVP